MQRINFRFMHSFSQSSHNELVSMPLIFGPSGSHDIWSRELCHGGSYKLPIDKQLHLDTPPRIGIINGPPRNALRCRDRFTPTMKRRWKQFYIDHDRNRADKNGFDD